MPGTREELALTRNGASKPLRRPPRRTRRLSCHLWCATGAAGASDSGQDNGGGESHAEPKAESHARSGDAQQRQGGLPRTRLFASALIACWASCQLRVRSRLGDRQRAVPAVLLRRRWPRCGRSALASAGRVSCGALGARWCQAGRSHDGGRRSVADVGSAPGRGTADGRALDPNLLGHRQRTRGEGVPPP